MKTGWQDAAKQRIAGEAWSLNENASLFFFDPREHNIRDPAGYTAVDLAWIEQSDLIFAYLEASNPGGPNMAFEMGYAHALGIPIVFINEGPREYWDMIHMSSVAHTELGFGYRLAGSLAAGEAKVEPQIKVRWQR